MSGIIAQNVLDNSGLIKAPVGGGAWTFIKKLTASGSANLSFVNGTSDVVLNSTYKQYLFTFNNIHPQTDNKNFELNFSDDTGSSYAVSKATTFFRPNHSENDSYAALNYVTGYDLGNSTGIQIISQGDGNENDESCSGYMGLYDPANTTFIKHFMCQINQKAKYPESITTFVSGFCNTTSAIDAVQFTYSSGNIDLGDICLYGLTI